MKPAFPLIAGQPARTRTPALLAAVAVAGLFIFPTGQVSAAPAAGQQAILHGYATAAGNPPSPAKGRQFFLAKHRGGKPDTPSCTVCHTANPKNNGKTRAGKTIAPMALSRTPDRFSDLAKIEKWFRRNCNSVLGRQCSNEEKANFLAFMFSQ